MVKLNINELLRIGLVMYHDLPCNDSRNLKAINLELNNVDSIINSGFFQRCWPWATSNFY